MLLPEMRMVDPLAAALSAAVLFAIVERSMLTVVLDAKRLTALPPLPEMIDLVTLANMLWSLSMRPSAVEPLMVTFFSDATLKPPELVSMIPVELSLITVSATNKNMVPLRAVKMPDAPSRRKFRIVHFSICTALAETMSIPTPAVPRPSMSRPRKVTTSVAAAWMKMPKVTATGMPAVPVSQEMVIALVMDTVLNLKLPGSRQLISPPALVFARAPLKVWQGAVRLQGLASSPV